MTKEETNRKIAEWCGWEYTSATISGKEKWLSRRPDKSVVIWYSGGEEWGPRIHTPAYTTDLNSCAEFEKRLRHLTLDGEYGRRLKTVIVEDAVYMPTVAELDFALITATPAQRCAALLAVIEGEASRG